MQVFDLTNKKQLGEYHGLSQGQRFFIVGVINYELAWRRKELLDLYDFTLMLDESSLIQNQKAKQTKFILKMKPAHVILLSGTPVGGKYENLWTQVHLLGWKISEDLYNRQYVNWTTIDSGGFQHKIVDKEDPYKNIDRLKSKMREHGAIFKKTEECYELPEQVFTHIRLKAPKEYWKFQKWYKNNPDDKIWWLNNPEVKGEWVFSFDKKTEFNMFRDYPHALTSEQKKIFDEENPYWKNFFKDRTQ